MNIVVLEGTLSSSPVSRTLPSGDVLVTYEVTTRPTDGPASSVPVVWFDPPDRAMSLVAGDEVVVTGMARRRFYRTPAGTRSSTEVVADVVHPRRHRARVDRSLAAVAAELGARSEPSASR